MRRPRDADGCCWRRRAHRPTRSERRPCRRGLRADDEPARSVAGVVARPSGRRRRTAPGATAARAAGAHRPQVAGRAAAHGTRAVVARTVAPVRVSMTPTGRRAVERALHGRTHAVVRRALDEPRLPAGLPSARPGTMALLEVARRLALTRGCRRVRSAASTNTRWKHGGTPAVTRAAADPAAGSAHVASGGRAASTGVDGLAGRRVGRSSGDDLPLVLVRRTDAEVHRVGESSTTRTMASDASDVRQSAASAVLARRLARHAGRRDGAGAAWSLRRLPPAAGAEDDLRRLLGHAVAAAARRT